MVAFGGDIICESEFVKYTKFSLLFPVLSEDKLKKFETNKSEDLQTKILLIDDQKTNLLATKQKIETSLPNIVCDTALNGEQALEIIKNNQDDYSLILLDIQMPNMNGIEVAKKIRKIN